MAQRRFVFVTVAMLAAVLLGPTLEAQATNKSSPQIQGQVDVSYVPLPVAASTAVGVHLDPLQISQLASIHVLAADAIVIAKARLGMAMATSNMTVSLGSFTDDQYVTINPSGARQLMANGLAAYVVSFSGLSIASLGRSGTSNTETNVVVNATTGEVVEEFSYR